MKIAKLIVLMAGLAGIVAFFLPVAGVRFQDTSADLSAFQLIEGMDMLKAAAVATKDRPEIPEEARAVVADIDANVARYRVGIFAFFAPALLFVALAVLGAFTRFGRLLGAFALLVGIAGTAGWALLYAATQSPEVTAAAVKYHYEMRVGVAVWIMIAASLVGVVGGLMALIKPEPKRD